MRRVSIVSDSGGKSTVAGASKQLPSLAQFAQDVPVISAIDRPLGDGGVADAVHAACEREISLAIDATSSLVTACSLGTVGWATRRCAVAAAADHQERFPWNQSDLKRVAFSCSLTVSRFR